MEEEQLSEAKSLLTARGLKELRRKLRAQMCPVEMAKKHPLPLDYDARKAAEDLGLLEEAELEKKEEESKEAQRRRRP